MICSEFIKPNFLNWDNYRMMVHLKIYTMTAINNFRATQNNSDFQFFLTNETQYRSKTIRAQEEFVPIWAASTM